ncbi:MAG TPA: VOC family protein [Steroidobacteraceae bacterium]|nr:VOC family protein [Steroidobacteraceae bacterium]
MNNTSPRQRGVESSAVTPLKRTAIIVRDMDRSLEFYRDVLRMNVWVEGAAGAELPALYQLLGMPPCNVRWVILQSGDVDFGMVGLFELTDPAPDDDTHRNVDRANRGEACLVFHTADVDGIYQRSRAIGLTVLCPPTVLTLEQHGVSSKEMTLRDPNGVLCNFIQNLQSGSLGLSNEFPWVRKRPATSPANKRRAAKRNKPVAKKRSAR